MVGGIYIKAVALYCVGAPIKIHVLLLSAQMVEPLLNATKIVKPWKLETASTLWSLNNITNKNVKRVLQTERLWVSFPPLNDAALGRLESARQLHIWGAINPRPCRLFAVQPSTRRYILIVFRLCLSSILVGTNTQIYRRYALCNPRLSCHWLNPGLGFKSCLTQYHIERQIGANETCVTCSISS